MLSQNISIEDKIIGPDHPVFIIAEAGVNHNGRLDLAKKLVLEAKKAGADCVKFQTFKAENLVVANAPKADYQLLVTDPRESQRAMLKKLELRDEDYFELNKLCQEVGIILMSTAYNFRDVDFLEELGVSAHKLASLHLTEEPMIEYVATKNKPVILSTGMSGLNDIVRAVNVFRSTGNEDLVLLQCTTNYPTTDSQVNLRMMDTIRRATMAVTGYSDHTEGMLAAVAAVASGARVIEEHFTLDRGMAGPDHSSSSDPEEFTEMVRQIRKVETMLGNPFKEITESEKSNIQGMRRSIAAVVDIKMGEEIKAHMIDFKRPATGLNPNRYKDILGKIAKRDIPADTLLTEEDI